MYYCSAWLRENPMSFSCALSLSLYPSMIKERIYLFLCRWMFNVNVMLIYVELPECRVTRYIPVAILNKLLHWFTSFLASLHNFLDTQQKNFSLAMAMAKYGDKSIIWMLFTLKRYPVCCERTPNTEIFLSPPQPNVNKNLIHSIWHEINHF